MSENHAIYIVGSGAIGIGLAAALANIGKESLLVRTSVSDMPEKTIEIDVTEKVEPLEPKGYRFNMIGLDNLSAPAGIFVVTAKAHANQKIAKGMAAVNASGPVVLLQNGLGIEAPFASAGFNEIYRCVLYTSSQIDEAGGVQFRSVNSSPVGVFQGDEDRLEGVLAQITTPQFAFHVDQNIQHSIWEKVVLNAVFNTICPLFEADNGLFWRSPEATAYATEIMQEGAAVAAAVGVSLDVKAMVKQMHHMSKFSAGQTISTHQDIMYGRQTEIESLNFAIAEVANRQTPPVPVEKTRLLGELVALKAKISLNGHLKHNN